MAQNTWDIELPDQIDITPNWLPLFKLAEEIIHYSDLEGKVFVLEMLRYGMRCYQTMDEQQKESTQ